MKNKVVDLLKAYYQKQKLDIKTFDKDFFMLLKEQSLLPYLHYVYDNQKLNSFYLSSVVYQEMMNDLQLKLTELFNQNNIRHLYVKGSILNKIYDDEALRTRGDIDVLIDAENLNKAKELLQNKGFEAEDEACMHHLEMKRNNSLIELHFSLLDPTDDYFHFFKKPFESAKKINGSYYELNYEEHFLYVLCHFAKHLRTGAGIRYVLDFYYMLKKWDLKMDYVHDLIKKAKLQTLYQNILNTLYIITGEKLDIYEEKDIGFFIDYLLENGIHGHGENANYDEKNYGEKRNKFKHMFNMIFMPNKQFRMVLYPRLGKHAITYPLCLICRVFHLIIHKSKSLFKFLFTKKSRSNKEKDDFYQKLGI